MVTSIEFNSELKLLQWEINGGLLDFLVDIIEGESLPTQIYQGSAMSCPLDISNYNSPLEVVVKQKSEEGKWVPLGKKLK